MCQTFLHRERISCIMDDIKQFLHLLSGVSEMQKRTRSTLRCASGLWRRRSCLTPVTSWRSKNLRARRWISQNHRSPALKRRNRAEGFATLSQSSTSMTQVDMDIKHMKKKVFLHECLCKILWKSIQDLQPLADLSIR